MAAKKDKPPRITEEMIERARRALWAAVRATKKNPKRKRGNRHVH